MEELKTPKGTRDFFGKEKILLEQIIEETEKIYRKRGGVPFDTPIFEIRSILMNKYGEDSKLIFDLAEQGGEICSLRYDLTVPFARYLAQTKTLKIKRYHTGKVFRRDQPSLSKGRYREFIQSDFDIVGNFEHMVADAEVVSSGCEILRYFSKKMGGTPYTLRINHKKLVDGLMDVCGVEKSIQKSICSSIDKLDKMSWEEVRSEMQKKGAEDASIEKIREYIDWKFPLSKLSKIRDSKLGINSYGAEAVRDLERLYELLILYGVDDDVMVDLSLIRGLEYYTGILLEGGYSGAEGSVIAGGRYDGLVNSLMEMPADEEKSQKKASKKKEASPVSCVGISLGVSRIFSILPMPKRKTYTDVLVCSVGSSLLDERVRACVYLRENGILAEYFMGSSGNFTRHSEYAEANEIDVLVLFGRQELEKQEYQIIWGDKAERQKITTSWERLPGALKEILEKNKENSEAQEDQDLPRIEDIYITKPKNE
ncbi:histidyl-tRNA synthetase [Nematocida sp. LUAm3]|nr:histidyl-tRNA synthetase [Nematocida sp. LUAm3]KAI5175465.1 histidyl-tRNA synthetase [Nematocida sp. LUAm2]KAI5178505.1 histidyl-tRNA synthetase [Nematocida sp. LUAm1]